MIIAEAGTQLKLDTRQLRALEMVSGNCEIKKIGFGSYLVKSQSTGSYYNVRASKSKWTCECKDYANRKVWCKHIYAVRMWNSEKLNH